MWKATISTLLAAVLAELVVWALEYSPQSAPGVLILVVCVMLANAIGRWIGGKK